MNINKKWLTLIELVVWVFLLVILTLIFVTITKQTTLFVTYSKQRFAIANELLATKESIQEILSNKKIEVLQKNEKTLSWIYSIKDTVLDFPNPLIKDIISIWYIENNTNSWIYIIGVVSKKNFKLLPSNTSENWYLGIKKIKSNTITELMNEDFKWYTNNNLNILELRYNITNSGSILRFDLKYDNNLNDSLDFKNDENSFLSWSVHLVKNLN